MTTERKNLPEANRIMFGLQDSEYRQIQAISQSQLKRFGTSKTPMHYRHDADNPRDETPSMRIGRAVDCRAFRPNDYADEFAIFSGKKRQGKAWEEFETANASKTILNITEAERVNGCVATLTNCEDFQQCLACSKYQVAVVAKHPMFNCWAKGLIDIFTPVFNDGNSWLFDLKTADSADATDFSRQAADLGYHVQAAWYFMLLDLCGDPRTTFGFFVVENEAPFVLNRISIHRDSDEIAMANRAIEKWLPRLLQCSQTNLWPGFTEEWKPLSFPRWVKEAA
jgi:hypothetical protein